MPKRLRHARGKQPDEVGLMKTTKIKSVIHTFLDMSILKLLLAVTVNTLKADIEPLAGPKEAKLFNELAQGCRALAASIMVNAVKSISKQMIYDS